MSKLEVLSLVYAPRWVTGSLGYDLAVHFTDLVPTSLCCQRLRAVSIKYFHITQQQLLGFLKAHSLTLRYVSMERGRLHGPPWRPFLKSLRDVVEKCMSVDEISLVDWIGDLSHNDEEDYVDLHTSSVEASSTDSSDVEDDDEGEGEAGKKENCDLVNREPATALGPRPRIQHWLGTHSNPTHYYFDYVYPA